MKLTFLSLVFALASAASWEAQQHVGVSDQGSESSTELLRGSSRRLQLPVVALVGNNGNPASAFPLKVCQGDCDSNSDCEGALECFFRDGGEAVPGCSGGESVSSRTDFCYDPNPNPAPVAMPPTTGGPSVTLIGNNGSPASAFPLKVCQGDCDSNSDCEGALECFFRDGGEAVPGCSGGESVSSRTDFCYDPNPNPAPVAMHLPWQCQFLVQPTTGGPSVTLIGNNGSPASAFPLKVCQGDCDSNSDCEGALECFFRDGGEAVPGCSGGESVSSRTDFCYDPNPNPAPVAMPPRGNAGPSVTLIGNNGSPASAFPLKVCQGDCDSNSDCEGALECFFRDGGEAVPGCSGGESVSSRTDFCYDPNPNPAPVAMPIPAPVAMPVPAPV
ncbi:frustulin 3, partial [Phaeodactylum tricornutum CCAP 1055/1]